MNWQEPILYSQGNIYPIDNWKTRFGMVNTDLTLEQFIKLCNKKYASRLHQYYSIKYSMKCHFT